MSSDIYQGKCAVKRAQERREGRCKTKGTQGCRIQGQGGKGGRVEVRVGRIGSTCRDMEKK